MNLLSIVKEFENKTSTERFELIENYLQKWEVPYHVQHYISGKNIFVKAEKMPFIGIGSHFDVVIEGEGGANDNASAIAVVLDLVRRNKENPLKNIGLQFFFFDEEEVGLKGSKAYIQKYGIGEMLGLINMELVGMGNQFALWSLSPNDRGNLLETFENQSKRLNIVSNRFDKIVTNTADHQSFKNAELNDSFTVTCISPKDVETAYHYYKAQEFAVDKATLYEIMLQAPIFKHYHQASDLSVYLEESALQMTAAVIWETV